MRNNDLDYVKELDFYRDRLQIDRNALDDELAVQAQLFWEVSEKHVQCMTERDELKAEVGRFHSQLGLNERVNLAEAGLKVTEVAIESRVLSNEDMIRVGNSYLSAKSESDTWFAMKEAFAQRSYVLKDMVSLYIAGYFGDVTPKANAGRLDTIKHEERKSAMAKQRRTLDVTDPLS